MNLVARAKNILLAPQKEWESIKGEDITVVEMFTQYAVILAAIPAVANLIGMSIVGYSVLGFHSRIPFGRGLLWCILSYLFSLVGVFLLGFIIDTLAPSFGSKKDMTASLKVAIFSWTASWVAGILMIVPVLSILSGIASLYSIYLLYLGMKSLKEAPQDKSMTYFIIILIVAIAIYLIIGAVVAAIVLGGYSGFWGFRG